MENIVRGSQRRQPGGSALELYVNQYVPSTLSSSLLGGLSMELQAGFFGKGTTATANLTFSSLPGSPLAHCLLCAHSRKALGSTNQASASSSADEQFAETDSAAR